MRPFRIALFVCFITFGFLSAAKSAATETATGLWQKVEGGKPVAWFLVYEDHGVYEAVLVKSFPGSGVVKGQVCSKCTDDRKNAPVLGISLVRGMKRDGKEYKSGKILDPSVGKDYGASWKLSPDGRDLDLSVHVPMSAFDGHESWSRLPNAALMQIDYAVLAKYLPQAAAKDDVLALQPVFFATNREIKNDSPITLASITAGRSKELRYGLTVVGVPKVHTIGHVERPKLDLLQSIVHFSLVYEPETDKDHFRVRSLEVMSRESLVEGLTKTSDSVLLFIHGYNVPFQDAVFKAAQIAYDANFGGSVLVFSWPSAGALLGYDYDHDSAAFSTEDLLKLFRLLSDDIGNKRVFVLAHSLGNEIVVDALQQAALSKTSLRISELMFAAPDVDKDVFLKKADDIKSVAKNMTLYASSADKALRASEEKSWGNRMGFVGANGPNLADGVDTIDVTAVGDDMLGLNHGTFSERAVLEDIGHLIMSTKDDEHLKPHKRLITLKFVPDAANVKYWIFPK